MPDFEPLSSPKPQPKHRFLARFRRKNREKNELNISSRPPLKALVGTPLMHILRSVTAPDPDLISGPLSLPHRRQLKRCDAVTQVLVLRGDRDVSNIIKSRHKTNNAHINERWWETSARPLILIKSSVIHSIVLVSLIYMKVFASLFSVAHSRSDHTLVVHQFIP